ncbi:MAG: hypothetical protein KF787_02825 [Phycisphaeraceae bacterium]|nr:hypothetical protein [Phycisphaerae bacterium]MBX3391561.1 hypothetical protein [Phycisphaeraceae bacterium]HRJ50336.1 hypothetical protein [Phycisphaerales bacterium]
MAKGQHFSAYQQGIIKRFYEHADSRTLTALQELVSEIAVSETDSARERHWKRAAEYLAKAGATPARAQAIINARDVKGLATLVGELLAGGGKTRPRGE